MEMYSMLDDDYDDNDEYDYKEFRECNDDRLILDANSTGLELGSSELNDHQKDDPKRARLF